MYPYSGGCGPNTPIRVSPRVNASGFNLATQHLSPSQNQPSQITQCTTTALHAVELTEHSQLRTHHLQHEDTTDTVPFQNNKNLINTVSLESKEVETTLEKREGKRYPRSKEIRPDEHCTRTRIIDASQPASQENLILISNEDRNPTKITRLFLRCTLSNLLHEKDPRNQRYPGEGMMNRRSEDRRDQWRGIPDPNLAGRERERRERQGERGGKRKRHPFEAPKILLISFLLLLPKAAPSAFHPLFPRRQARDFPPLPLQRQAIGKKTTVYAKKVRSG